MVTFIVPSIGRPTLPRALASIRAQTDPNWKAIVCFDHVKPTIEPDEKVKVLQFNDDVKGWRAGPVRNHAILAADTPWVGMLDDDDTVTPNYVKLLSGYYSSPADVVVFQMKYPNGRVLPTGKSHLFMFGWVGISFAFRREIIKKLQFCNMKFEDTHFLRGARAWKLRVVMCPTVAYKVKH